MGKIEFDRRSGPVKDPKLSKYNFSVGASNIISAIGKIKDTRWPKPIQIDPSQRNPDVMCKYHDTHEHKTKDSRQLKVEVDLLFNEGNIREFISDRAKPHFRENDANRKNEPEKPLLVIHMIIGGADVPQEPTFKYTKVSITKEKLTRSYVLEDALSFCDEEAEDVSQLHNDALLISIHLNKFRGRSENSPWRTSWCKRDVRNRGSGADTESLDLGDIDLQRCLRKSTRLGHRGGHKKIRHLQDKTKGRRHAKRVRVLVSNGKDVECVLMDPSSSANIIRSRDMKQLGQQDHIVPTSRLLNGFKMASETTKGEIFLPINVAGTLQDTRFHVIEGDMRYNALLGKPWIHNMRVVPSTLHQMMKFPTENGVKIVHREQHAAKEMFTIEEVVLIPESLTSETLTSKGKQVAK
ncbi:uncharacterized protein [Nicotiana sylvestris]|uniref:uncharacterized protein n=1 Tax=Nicotiana sylvestris TaxID=4096 RepID=UPI00388CA183